MKNFDWKKYIPNAVILGIFLVASAIYFWPALEGKIVYAGDNVNGTAACHESNAYKEINPEGTWWTGSMFSGMPNFQLGGYPGYQVDHLLSPLREFLSWGNRNTFFIFLFYLCAFFLLFRAFKVDKWLSMAGAFATSLSSYFFIIIAAQHHGKCYTITWMMLVIVGFILTYRKQYGWGALLVMFFTYIGFFLHPQMSYYICMLIGMLWFAEIAIAAQEKEWKHFCIATVVFFASFGIGMGMGSANIFANQEYAEQTMRGGHSDLEKTDDATNKTGGLDIDYATAWSYGIDETMTLLIPNYMGGATGYDLGEGSELEEGMKKLGVPSRQAKGFCQNAPTYWGNKPFTSGPVYVGAIICFLFVLGLLIVPGPYKWALLAATLFSFALSWGHNMMWLTRLFFDYFPMYNKFRTVESILIVAEITMPLLGILAVKELVEGERKDWHKKAILIAGSAVGGLCLFVALFSNGFHVTSTDESNLAAQLGDQIYALLLDQRHAMMKADAWRSLLFVLAGAVLCYWFAMDQKMEKSKRMMVMGFALTGLIVVDMWPVDKHFCNDSNFVSVKKRDEAFKMQPYERELLANDTSYFRVLNLANRNNVFNEARTSYYLKSIGGYSPAKLRRYQDLIDEHIGKMNWNVLNMLNTKYIIQNNETGEPYPYINPDAMGNAWLVDRLVAVDNANAESDSLRTLDLRHVAVYDETYPANAHITERPAVNTLQAFDSEEVECLSYAPNKLVYHAQVETPRTAVFSEIYYPYGWKATIDGEAVDIFRVNYMLRAITLPAGEHEVVFVFDPDSVRKGNKLAMMCFCAFLLTLIGTCGYYVYRRKRNAATK